MRHSNAGAGCFTLIYMGIKKRESKPRVWIVYCCFQACLTMVSGWQTQLISFSSTLRAYGLQTNPANPKRRNRSVATLPENPLLLLYRPDRLNGVKCLLPIYFRHAQIERTREISSHIFGIYPRLLRRYMRSSTEYARAPENALPHSLRYLHRPSPIRHLARQVIAQFFPVCVILPRSCLPQAAEKRL